MLPGTRVVAFDSLLFIDDVKTPLQHTMRAGTIISARIDEHGRSLLDIQFDHRPKEVSNGHFTEGVKEITASPYKAGCYCELCKPRRRRFVMVEDIVEKDFVYCGRRFLNHKEIAHCIRVIEGAVLGDERLYSVKLRHPSIGAVYHGAAFGTSRSLGLVTAKYSRMWPDRDARIVWQAQDQLTTEDERRLKMEADSRKNDEFATMLLPLRKSYSAAVKRNDYALCHALERAVVRALKRPITLKEIG